MGVELSKEKPKNTEHEKYRTWQINQPFASKNDLSKIDLSDSVVGTNHGRKWYPRRLGCMGVVKKTAKKNQKKNMICFRF